MGYNGTAVCCTTATSGTDVKYFHWCIEVPWKQNEVETYLSKMCEVVVRTVLKPRTDFMDFLLQK
jgi:hypothetical protein